MTKLEAVDLFNFKALQVPDWLKKKYGDSAKYYYYNNFDGQNIAIKTMDNQDFIYMLEILSRSLLEDLKNEPDLDIEKRSSRLLTECKDLRNQTVLLDMAVKKFGIPLWSGSAWHKSRCEKRCPFGDDCNKKLHILGDTQYCRGQICMNFSCDLPNGEQTTLMKLVEQLNPSEQAYIKQTACIGGYFSDVFGVGISLNYPKSYRRRQKPVIYGHNVIPYL